MPLGRTRVLVEDDRKTVQIICAYLEGNGFEVTMAHDGKDGLESALNDSPDLVILDLLLPHMSDMQVCCALRPKSGVPIIMLTALTTEQDKLSGLNLGADDYVTKPFSPKELLARVRPVLRRATEETRSAASTPLSYRTLNIDPNSRSVTVQDHEVRLTPTEFRLLEILMREPGRLFSRSQLVEKVLGYDYDGMDRTIDVHVLNLRRKIETDPKHNQYIHTVYGCGCKLGG